VNHVNPKKKPKPKKVTKGPKKKVKNIIYNDAPDDYEYEENDEEEYEEEEEDDESEGEEYDESYTINSAKKKNLF